MLSRARVDLSVEQNRFVVGLVETEVVVQLQRAILLAESNSNA